MIERLTLNRYALDRTPGRWVLSYDGNRRCYWNFALADRHIMRLSSLLLTRELGHGVRWEVERVTKAGIRYRPVEDAHLCLDAGSDARLALISANHN
ncbi:hypothetical protein [Micromonospora chalcea]|uniref:hypothetical protein n=1 Tax=Micromonospora chalcea TaxID=1874 RepID=UPI00333039F6